MKTFFTALILSALALSVQAIPTDNAEDALRCCGATTPFYRAYSPSATDHFYTTSVSEYNTATSSLGYQKEGIAARVYPATGTHGVGAVPFYRLYSASGTDHFYTTSASERDNAVQIGYTYEGVSSYIYPSALCKSVPFYRLYNPTIVDHFYTTSLSERNNAINNLGYNNEGVAGYVNSKRSALC
ncbi:uncharacterized protein BXZ73DRAFT_103052 [Epithele typhae]|uniref:uncharacterized protein n=1 Tax=Epithele typhae TaxID=378194 RepID=UPI002008DDEA|nr:uncharacterized protein BXZ73DRAFT_103052 [Epithele typhae]KAH9925880.1 hypothetical protein BXZ73DRAFT_103052 [Epithele typhae]